MQIDGHLIYPIAAFIFACCLSWQRITPWRSMAPPLVVTATACCGLHFALGGWHELVKALLCGMTAMAIFAVVYFRGGIARADLFSIGVVSATVGSGNTTALVLLTSVIGAIMAFVVADKRQKIANFLMWRIREATHTPFEECIAPSSHRIPPEFALQPYYRHAVTIGALLTLIQAVTF